MTLVILLVVAAAMFSCAQEEVVPAVEVERVQSDYHETPEGGLSDREGCLGC